MSNKRKENASKNQGLMNNIFCINRKLKKHQNHLNGSTFIDSNTYVILTRTGKQVKSKASFLLNKLPLNEYMQLPLSRCPQ